MLTGRHMDDRPAVLGIEISVGPDSEPEEIDEAARQLRRDLLDIDVRDVTTPQAGEAPPGSRAVGLAALGALLVNIADSQFLGAVVAAARSWLAASSRRSIKLQLDGDVLELTGVSSSEQRRLTDEWLERHGGSRLTSD
jgi:hypothetical protein